MGRLITAGAEGFVTRACQDDHANGVIPASLLEGIEKLLAGLGAESIVDIWAVDGDRRHTVPCLEQDVLIDHVASPDRCLVTLARAGSHGSYRFNLHMRLPDPLPV